MSKTCDYNVRYLAGMMSRFGLDAVGVPTPMEVPVVGMPEIVCERSSKPRT